LLDEAGQPFWACRCFRSELQRMIRAFAIRTASVLDDCLFGRCVSMPLVGSIRDCVAAVELCSTGCTLMGPGDVGLLFAIMDNSRRPAWFDGSLKSVEG
jgi:hypothetical protein